MLEGLETGQGRPDGGRQPLVRRPTAVTAAAAAPAQRLQPADVVVEVGRVDRLVRRRQGEVAEPRHDVALEARQRVGERAAGRRQCRLLRLVRPHVRPHVCDASAQAGGRRRSRLVGVTHRRDLLFQTAQALVLLHACRTQRALQGAAVLRFRTVLRRTIHKLRHFHWLLPWSADSTANKNDVIYVLSYVGPS